MLALVVQAPFENSSGGAFVQLRFDTHGRSSDGLKGHFTVLVREDGIASLGAYLLPALFSTQPIPDQEIAQGIAGRNVLRIVLVVDVCDAGNAEGQVANLELSIAQGLLSNGHLLRAGRQNRHE